MKHQWKTMDETNEQIIELLQSLDGIEIDEEGSNPAEVKVDGPTVWFLIDEKEGAYGFACDIRQCSVCGAIEMCDSSGDYTAEVGPSVVGRLVGIDYDLSGSQGGKMSSTISWNQNTGEIKMTIPVSSQEITLNFPTEYWGLLSSVDDLYVGYSKEFDYTMTNEGTTTGISMNISVTSQTDVTVLAGTFEDCYVLECAQIESNSYSSNQPSVFMKVWISEDGVVPKVESTVLGMYITQELEGYYTT